MPANPLLRVLTRYVARKPAMWSTGGAAQARISGLTCELWDSHEAESRRESWIRRRGSDHAGNGGSWAHLLACLTLRCVAKPYWWHGGQHAQAATYRVNVRDS